MSLSLQILMQIAGDAQPQINLDALPKTQATDAFITTALNIVFTIVGAIAVLMIVIGGIKYAGSQGDPQGVSKAKGTIIYAVVGLIIVILAAAIVNFITARVTT